MTLYTKPIYNTAELVEKIRTLSLLRDTTSDTIISSYCQNSIKKILENYIPDLICTKEEHDAYWAFAREA